ncbi:MAG: TrmH family RNA methyltransferase [Candidatus Latescibacteria bacterium]|nr:TrmH family RNA methyltransferase [Candidatus Latescibacterota bacterium]
MEQVLSLRTRHLTVVLEDIYQPHNASAVLRSCECFGVQDVHVVENRNTYKVNPDVDQGASKWLDLIRYNDADQDNTRACLARLRSRGYRLVAATPHSDDQLLDEIEVEQPLALLLGTEEVGLSPNAMAEADAFVKVPMFGFTESFNISVCAALMLRELTAKIRRSDLDWRLTAAEKLDLRLQWYRRSLRRSQLLEERFVAGQID